MNNIVYRKAQKSDSIREIAKLLYLTDPYIYPAASPSFEGIWCEVIKGCLEDEQDFYYQNNLYVAECEGRIVGVIAAVQNGKAYRFAEFAPKSAVAQEVWEGYYTPLAEECLLLSGQTVVNFCTDPAYRAKGIGKGLFAYYLSLFQGETIYLDVLADNNAAIGLYQSFGFQIVKGYKGFGGGGVGVDCYHMIKP